MQKINNAPKIVGSIVISAVLLIGAYVVLSGNMDPKTTNVATVTSSTGSNTTAVPASQTQDQNNNNSANKKTSNNSRPAKDTAPAASTKYKDGDYSTSLTYSVPEDHTESIYVTVTLADDSVSKLVIDTVATNGESAEYQDPFDSQIIGSVEGKNLDEADVSRLGGASLTSDAFNSLLDAIRSESRI